MQDPICAMKKWRLLNRHLGRPELRAAWQQEYGEVAYPIDSQFASNAGVLFTAPPQRLVGTAL